MKEKKHMTRLTPISGRVLVRQDVASATTEGGLILPDVAKNKPSCGIVLAVYTRYLTNDGIEVVPQVAVGDRVIFIPYAPEKVTIDDEELLLIRESDILTVWIKEEKVVVSLPHKTT